GHTRATLPHDISTAVRHETLLCHRGTSLATSLNTRWLLQGHVKNRLLTKLHFQVNPIVELSLNILL
ncbi:hypothetical protein J6590_087038, partial [Homalodisca vitripennis]